ncbi:MAG: hypothetical protein RIR77_2081 [Planctomycetota bacterium]
MHNPAFPRAPQHLLRVVAWWCGYVLRRELRCRSSVQGLRAEHHERRVRRPKVRHVIASTGSHAVNARSAPSPAWGESCDTDERDGARGGNEAAVALTDHAGHAVCDGRSTDPAAQEGVDVRRHAARGDH